ncbi:uncharacterized protein LOC130447987 [Diorhabda sublineata]|uniref:uncharacterized protein LOC130447987 n=1 Tax=Diorhabda sublineata TaxID=1163346 RepID=UPI0024E056AC|nr:uncharacterized protein LOC130447987 [Diorhabda sublineata]XP_056641068.1 uncharacterized protein LOC130447987 [Diorhabda sublineata]
MPRHRDVPSLELLSLKSIGCLVVQMAPTILSKISVYKEPQKVVSILQKNLSWLNNHLSSHIPFYLYDQMAMEVLKAVEALVEETKKSYYPRTSMSRFLTEMNVAVSLTEVVVNHYLKSVDLSRWPKIMRYLLYKKLHKLTGLENLYIGSCLGGWRTSEFDRCLLDSISQMKHLKSLCLCFDGTDFTVQTVGENCLQIQCLDLTSSIAVTDRCIPFLLKCVNLKELQLHRTSVTTEGLAQLIVGLPKLQDLGRCDDFGNVIKHLHHKYPNEGPFALKKIQTRDITTENLRLLVWMFPKIEYVSLFHDVQISDLTVLISLDHLKDLKLLSCAFYSDYLQQLLEIRGTNITSLHLEHVEELDFKVLVDISQYCPKLKNLVCYNCDFRNSPIPNQKFKVHPFLNLERIFWVVDSAVSHLEFILNHAYHIKYIHLGSSNGITHSSIVNILTVNSMKKLEELRVLYSSDMNMRTVELLLASCTNLKVLSELESWQGININELETFKKYIITNNFDLDIRPTLSFTI